MWMGNLFFCSQKTKANMFFFYFESFRFVSRKEKKRKEKKRKEKKNLCDMENSSCWIQRKMAAPPLLISTNNAGEVVGECGGCGSS